MAIAAFAHRPSHPLGFAFAAPGELKVEKGTYRGGVAGPHDTVIYRFVDDDIEYKVVVIDITGVAAMDVTVANHLVQTVEASRLLGATVIVTGLSPEIAQTLVTIGVDLGKMNTVGDLQGGIEQAERLLGYKVMALAEPN